MNTNYAGFWLRFVAIIIDGIIVGIVQGVLIMPVLGIFGLGIAKSAQNLEAGDEAQALSMVAGIMALMGIAQLVFWVIQILYHTLMESSKYQGSVGKIVLGLKVTDLEGNKLDFGKAFVRNLCKVVSGLILCIGYIMAGLTEKKQALHDMIASTLVVKK
ncbi:RDD family protein [Chryseolinea lacunae]|uniref:RDD family protein n=1 Tax=Chryseolinea lacunae TaxID=2801331 RepID=A0ABS1KQG7_9BACT|nr:RDD family protein [Chryseolinea lacunae]MBL0741723.1 RDD family protein [Chryseolinea lacunae]